MKTFDEVYLKSTPNRSMCPEMGVIVGQALGKRFNNIVLGMDYMKSSRMMRDALVSGILSTGANILDLGYVPAPVTSMMAKEGDCAVYVTEHHEYGLISGFILITKEGCVFDNISLKQLNSILDDDNKLVKPLDVGHITNLDDYVKKYNVDIIREIGRDTGCPMILDCSCGCCSLSAPQVLNAISSVLITLNAQRDRDFHTDVNVSIAESELRNLRHFINNYQGYIGVALNRIGTQLNLVDEMGEDVPFDILATLLIKYLKPKNIVLPYDANRLLVDACKGMSDIDIVTPHENEEECKVTFTDTNLGSVCNAVNDFDSCIGFYKGGVIYGDRCPMPDAIYTSAVVSQMASRNNINNLRKRISTYNVQTIEVKFKPLVDDFYQSLIDNIKVYEDWSIADVYDEHEISPIDDGLRVDMDDGWGVIKLVSLEEGIAEVTAGSKDKAYMVGLLEVLVDVINRISSVN